MCIRIVVSGEDSPYWSVATTISWWEFCVPSLNVLRIDAVGITLVVIIPSELTLNGNTWIIASSSLLSGICVALLDKLNVTPSVSGVVRVPTNVFIGTN